MRQYQEQIELARHNVELQRDVLKIVQARFTGRHRQRAGRRPAQTTLSQTEAQIPAFEILLRQSQDQLCTLLGIPPADLQARLGQRPIPTAPNDVVVGIPAQLLERRPDIRSAERNAAAQAQQIGIAEAELYPHISITGTLGYSALNASQLFTYPAFEGSVGPSFQWNILNYGRIANNVRLQDAKFQQTLLDYRTAVLTANQETEDGLVSFLRSQEQAKMLAEAVVAADKAFRIVRCPVSRGHGRLQPSGHHRTEPGAAQVPQAQARTRLPWAWCRSIGPWAAAGRSAWPAGSDSRLTAGDHAAHDARGPGRHGKCRAGPNLNPAAQPGNLEQAPLPPPQAKLPPSA